MVQKLDALHRKVKWFVRRESDGRFLCRDGRWRIKASSYDDIKFYSSPVRAHKFGLRGQDGTAIAVYETDTIYCDGRIEKGES